MKIPSLPRFTRLLQVAATASIFAGGGVIANAQTLNFTPNAPLQTDTYSGLTAGDSVSTIGWTGTEVNVQNVIGADPSDPNYAPGGTVLSAVPGSRRRVTSPALTLPDFGESDVLYFSAWLKRSSAANSGAKVFLMYIDSGNLSYTGGFGFHDGTQSIGGTNYSNPFGLFDGTTWHHSTETAIANHWYEVTLVIRYDADDAAASQGLGYLYVRDATAGDEEFRLVNGLEGIVMNYTETHNPYATNNWRLDNFNNNAQAGQLSMGTGTLAIPEPGTVSLVILSGLALGGYRLCSKRAGAKSR